MAKSVESMVNEKFDQFVSDKNLMNVLEFYIGERVNGMLSKEELNKIIESIISNSYATIDVSKLFVCIYDDNKVGFFYKETLVDATSLTNPILYDVYRGFESDYTAISKSSYHLDNPGTYDIYNYPRRNLLEINNHVYTTSATVTEKLGSYEEIWQMMRESTGNTEPYNIGMASRKDMSEVLAFAFKMIQKSNRTK